MNSTVNYAQDMHLNGIFMEFNSFYQPYIKCTMSTKHKFHLSKLTYIWLIPKKWKNLLKKKRKTGYEIPYVNCPSFQLLINGYKVIKILVKKFSLNPDKLCNLDFLLFVLENNRKERKYITFEAITLKLTINVCIN